MSTILPKSVLNEVFGVGEQPTTKEPMYPASMARGTEGLKGFRFGSLIRSADKDGMPAGEPVEINRGKIMKHWGESNSDFHNRLHIHFQKPIQSNEAYSYTPHVSSLNDYLGLRAGRPFAHVTYTDPKTKEVSYISHHLYPIYKD